MTKIIDTTSNHSRSAKLASGVAIAAILALGTFAGSADAQWGGNYREYYHNWNGGYYRAPPVVYGSPYGSSYYGTPYYYPPLVMYQPSYNNYPGPRPSGH